MIGDTLKRLRLQAGMTQEQVAEKLGVTAPAVNKWENNRTMPDIALLAPLARLMRVSTDELLSFEAKLTEESVNACVAEMAARLEKEPFSDVLADAEEKLRIHPNEPRLKWQLAAVFAMRCPEENEASVLPALASWYREAMDDEQEERAAAQGLFYLCLRMGKYDEALEAAGRLPEGHPERKQMEADVYAKTGRRGEAFRAFEELVLAGYIQVSQALNSLRVLATEDGDRAAAQCYARAAGAAARALDMGRYQEVSPMLDVAAAFRDESMTVETLKAMLESVGTLGAFAASPLYRHMTTKAPDGAVERGVRAALAEIPGDPAFEYMKSSPAWARLCEKMTGGPSSV